MPTMPTELVLTSRIDEAIRETLWNGQRIRIGGQDYVTVDSDEVPDMDDDEDVVLRGPDGVLYDVEIDVTVSTRLASP